MMWTIVVGEVEPAACAMAQGKCTTVDVLTSLKATAIAMAPNPIRSECVGELVRQTLTRTERWDPPTCCFS